MAKAKSTTQKNKNAPIPAVPAVPVPAAIREPKAPKKGGLMGRLAAMGRKEAPKTSAQKKRPQMQLMPAAKEQFALVAPAKAIFERVESYLKNERALLDEMLRNEYLRIMWENKNKPDNPNIVVSREDGKPDCTGLFANVAKWHVSEITTEDGESPEDAMVRSLVETCGLSEDHATDLVHAELDFTPTLSIPLTEDNEAAAKLMAYLAGEDAEGHKVRKLELSDEEKASLIVVKAQVKVLSGFMDRLCGYCETVDQLEAILTTVIKPEWHLKSVKFGVSDSDKTRIDRLVDFCREILEGEEEEEEDDDE